MSERGTRRQTISKKFNLLLERSQNDPDEQVRNFAQQFLEQLAQ
ncbi:MAG: hypothetical protein ACRDBG_28725 [Waterburya sp.]